MQNVPEKAFARLLRIGLSATVALGGNANFLPSDNGV